MNADSRKEQLNRLTYYKTGLSDPNYLHYKSLFEDITTAIKTHAKGDVLDIGCGNKPYKNLFNNVTSSYIGCDIIQSSGNEVDIICSCTDIPLPDASKDTVFCTQVMEHVAEHEKLLSEAYRILKQDGYILLTVPMCWEHHEEPYDFFRFTRYGLQYLFEKTGFTNIKIKANGGKWAQTGQIMINSFRSSINKENMSLKRKMFRLFFKVFGIKWLINIFFSFLEKIDPDDKATLNFIVVAQKVRA